MSSWYAALPTATADTVRMTWKCRQCKAFWVRDVETRVRHVPGVSLGGHWNPARDVTEYRHDDGEWRAWPEPRTCCFDRVSPKRLQGVLKPEKRCTDSCRTAKSNKCICECGGSRHGEAWGRTAA